MLIVTLNLIQGSISIKKRFLYGTVFDLLVFS